MISTVTTSTVSTVTLAGSFAIVGVVVLLALLVQKELASSQDTSHRVRHWSQALTIGIAPLLIAFVLVVITKIGEVLR